MTRRFSPYQRSVIYDSLVKRDGEKCACPGTPPTCEHQGPDQPSRCVRVTLEIDHIDGNTGNNIMPNFRLLCSTCNARWREFIKAKQLFADHRPGTGDQGIKSVYVQNTTDAPKNATERNQIEIDFQSGSPEMQVTGKAEMPYRNWLVWVVSQKKRKLYRDAIDEGAEEFGVSTATIIRYTRKICSAVGPLAIEKDELLTRYIINREDKKKRQKELWENPPKSGVVIE